MSERFEVAIAGGGPAGLAAAAQLAARGMHVVVLERAPAPVDKACGEGLMPKGLRELDLLGALALLDRSRTAQFEGIRYVQEDGGAVEARFRAGSGLGLRRTVLAEALWARASALGAERRRCSVRGLEQREGEVLVHTDAGSFACRLLVGADGLQSAVRKLAGLDDGAPGPRRFGLRRHFALAPWSPLVEVHWQAGLEAYLTPISASSINVAFLWDEAALDERASFQALLSRFPRLQERLLGARAESEARGAGPLLRPVRARVAERIALVGDAAGYVDAITGQGLSLAFIGARLLAAALPRALEGRALRRGLRRYEAGLRRHWLHYALPARALLGLSRRPALRRGALRLLASRPGLFGALLSAVG
jgi:2-polyprenyl-6-methoxyphenol hydroxylase-like FAD-dependent oxidoreductase